MKTKTTAELIVMKHLDQRNSKTITDKLPHAELTATDTRLHHKNLVRIQLPIRRAGRPPDATSPPLKPLYTAPHAEKLRHSTRKHSKQKPSVKQNHSRLRPKPETRENTKQPRITYPVKILTLPGAYQVPSMSTTLISTTWSAKLHSNSQSSLQASVFCL